MFLGWDKCIKKIILLAPIYSATEHFLEIYKTIRPTLLPINSPTIFL